MAIKIITLNAWQGGILFSGIVDFLREQDADIVIMQEVFSSDDIALERQYRTIPVLPEELGYQYYDFVADFRDFAITDGMTKRGNAIMSKFPIVEKDARHLLPYSETYRDVPGKYHECPRNLQQATIQTPEGELHVFNIQGVWDMDGDNYSAERQHMSKIIVDAVKGKQHVILGGDTNAQPTNQAIKDIEEHLTNIFGRELPSTFNLRRKSNPAYAGVVVDMIFASSDLKVLEKACHDVDISDHLPLSATIAL